MKICDLNDIKPELKSIIRVSQDNCLAYGVSYGKRVVKHYELDYITWGEGSIITDGERVPAKRGTLFFREPGMIVEGIAPYHCYFLTLDLFDESVTEGIGSECSKGYLFPSVFDVEDHNAVEKLLIGIYSYYLQPEEVSSFAIKSKLMQLFLMLYGYSKKDHQLKFKEERRLQSYEGIYLVESFIKENPCMKYALEELSKKAGYSPYYFCRLFKKVTGETPIAYVNQCRLNYIRKELIETQKSIKEIIIASGIENEAYFYRTFKRYNGNTPKEYREKHREMYNNDGY